MSAGILPQKGFEKRVILTLILTGCWDSKLISSLALCKSGGEGATAPLPFFSYPFAYICGRVLQHVYTLYTSCDCLFYTCALQLVTYVQTIISTTTQ